MAKRRLRIPVLLEPIGGSPVELGGELGLVLRQLPPEQVPEQRVVAVCLAVAIEWADEQMQPLEPGEHPPGALAPQHGIAHRSGQLLEHRCAPEERQEVGLQRLEELGAKVLGQEAIVATRDWGTGTGGFQLLPGEYAQPEPGGPALAPCEELRSVLVRKLRIQLAQERLGFAGGQRQLVDRHLEQSSAGPQAGNRQAGWPARRDRERRARGNVLREGGDRLSRAARVEQVGVVQDEHERPGRRQPGRERRQVHSARRLRVEPIEGRGELCEQDGGVVVAFAEREPRERPAIALGPLRQERRFSVAGGSHEGDDGGRCRAEAVDERGSRHRPRRRGRQANLGVDDVRRLGPRAAGA